MKYSFSNLSIYEYKVYYARRIHRPTSCCTACYFISAWTICPPRNKSDLRVFWTAPLRYSTVTSAVTDWGNSNPTLVSSLSTRKRRAGRVVREDMLVHKPEMWHPEFNGWGRIARGSACGSAVRIGPPSTCPSGLLAASVIVHTSRRQSCRSRCAVYCRPSLEAQGVAIARRETHERPHLQKRHRKLNVRPAPLMMNKEIRNLMLLFAALWTRSATRFSWRSSLERSHYLFASRRTASSYCDSRPPSCETKK